MQLGPSEATCRGVRSWEGAGEARVRNSLALFSLMHTTTIALFSEYGEGGRSSEQAPHSGQIDRVN